MAGNDLLNSLKGMLGDNADEKINAVINMLKSDTSPNIQSTAEKIENDIIIDNNNSSGQNSPEANKSDKLNTESAEFISKIKSVIDEMGSANDPRSNLLMSLRPYMRDTRKKSIDSAVKILNLSRFSGLFNI